MTNKPIYLDYNATTPLIQPVIEAMLPYLTEHFGNPSSVHPYGRTTRQAVDKARRQMAQLLGCHPGEIIFTSGGTEANNTVVKGIAQAYQERGRHIITSAVEHPAILEPCRILTEQGYDVTVLPVDEYGQVNPSDVEAALTSKTILISIMLANNEVGTIQPIRQLADIAHEHDILFHSDAAQAIGKISVNVDELGIDMLSVAGHKLYAPKGVGVLYVRDGVNLPSFMHGASHEFGRRAGTENVLEIVGLGKAAETAYNDLAQTSQQLATMRDHLEHLLTTQLEHVRVNGHPDQRLPNTLSISFQNIQANMLLDDISQQVAASAGAACHADQVTVSAVLAAMQVPTDYAMGTLRLTTGRLTTQSEIETAAQTIIESVRVLRVTN